MKYTFRLKYCNNNVQILRINNANRFQVVEILRAISELIVYGSQGNDAERIFDYFCENGEKIGVAEKSSHSSLPPVVRLLIPPRFL